MEWMNRFRNDFDKATFDPKWYRPELVYVAPDGTAYEGRDKALEAIKALYGPLPAFRHEAVMVNVIERDFGYEMIGRAMMWANLPGEPAPGETKKKDADGKEWDLVGPGGFRFFYVKEGNNFALSRLEMMADTAPLTLGLVRRGVISTKDLGI